MSQEESNISTGQRKAKQMNNMKNTKQDITPSDQEPASSKKARLTASNAVPATASTLRSDNQPEQSRRTRSQTKLKCSGPPRNEIEHKTPSDEESSSSKRPRHNSPDVVRATATASTPPREGSSVTISTIHSASQDNNNLIDPASNPASPSGAPHTDEKSYGLKATLHGITYQQKLLILTLCHAAKRMKDDNNVDCTITSEDPESGKFDDIVFRFKDGNQWRNLLIQAKHKQDTSKTITWKAFKSTDEAAPFAISKYFNSFLSLDRNESNVFVLCTNAELETKLKDSMVPYSFKTAVFSSFFESITAEVQRIDVKKMTKKDKKELYDLMINNSDFVRLTKQLAERIMNKEAVNFNDSLFNKYRPFIEKLASSIRNDKQFYDIDEKCFDVHQEFKTSFAQECRTLLGKNSKYDIWKVIRKNGIKLNITKDPTSHNLKRLVPPIKPGEKQIQDFFASFIMVSNTKHERHIPEVIINMLESCDAELLSPEIQGSISSKIAYEKLSDWILDWMKEKNSKSLNMKEIKAFFNMFESQINFLHLEGISNAYCEKLQSLDLQCCPVELKNRRLYEELDRLLTKNDETSSNKIIIERCSYPSWLVLEILKVLRDNYNKQNYSLTPNYKLNFLFLEAASYKNTDVKVKNVFCALNSPLILVVDYERAVAEIGKFEKWQNIHKENINTHTPIKIILTIEQSFMSKYNEKPLSIKHLTVESKIKIGEKIAISTLYGTKISYNHIFCAEDSVDFVWDVVNLPSESAVKRNIIADNYNDIKPIYIHRRWKRWTKNHNAFDYKTSKGIWRCGYNIDNMRNSFTSDEVSAGEITLDRFFDFFKIGIIPDAFSSMYKLVQCISHQHPPGIPINNLVKDSKKRKKFGCLSGFDSSDEDSDFIESGGRDSALNASDVNKKVHVIFNEAGSGKSFYLTWLAWHLQSMEEFTDSWIIKFHLIKYSAELENLQNAYQSMNELQAIRLLFQLTYLAFHTNTNLENYGREDKGKIAEENSQNLLLSGGKIMVDKSPATSEELVLLRIFEHKFNGKNLIVLMDGFDEIAPDYKGVVLKLLSILKNLEGVYKIYLTSRPYDFQKEIEAELGVCGYYRLENFNNNELLIYTHGFLLVHFEGYFLNDNTYQLTVSLVHLLLLKLFLSNIINIPLFVSMGHELLVPIVEKYWYEPVRSGFILLKTFDACEKQFAPLSIMETFIRNKLIITSKKSGTCIATAEAKRNLERRYETIKKNHSVLALYAVLNKGKVEEILPSKKQEKAIRYMEELKNGSEKSGIVDGIVHNVPIFTHRLFAEYFAAEWFNCNYNRETVKDYLQCCIYANKEKEEIRQFLDRMICEKNILHMAVLDDSSEKVKSLMIKSPNLIDDTDCWGRTPLQLAWQCESEVMVRLLISWINETTIDAKDKYFEWTTLIYAHNAFKISTSDHNGTQNMFQHALPFEFNLIARFAMSTKRNRVVSFLIKLYSKLAQTLESENQLSLGSSIETEKIFKIWRTGYNARETAASDHNCISLLELCTIIDSPMLEIAVHKSTETEYFESRVPYLIELALEHRSVNALQFLTVHLKFPMPPEYRTVPNFEHELLVLVALMQSDKNRFRNDFHEYCDRHNVSCLEENQLQQVFDVPRCGKSISFQIDLWRYYPTHFTIETSGIDVGTELLIARALQTNNLSMLEYLILKTKTAVNNRLIKRIVQIQKVDWYCQSSSHFLINRSVDLRGVDVDGQNLLHFAVEHAQFNLVKCLIELYDFTPTDINSKEHSWNAYFYCVKEIPSAVDFPKMEMQRLNIFKYLMDLRQEAIFDDCDYLDLNGSSVCNYSSRFNRKIFEEICERRVCLLLKRRSGK